MSNWDENKYLGIWSGYVITVAVDGVVLSCRTKDGLRGTSEGTADVVDGKIVAFSCDGQNVELK